MRITSDWDAVDFGLPAVAPATSVFSRREFLETWWVHFGRGELHLVEDGDAVLPLDVGSDGAVRFVGDEDLTDYHSPLGTGAGALLARYLQSRPMGTRYRFDSLPAEAADELQLHLPAATTRHRHEAAFQLTLPPTFDEWLATRRKKERHELRRKYRRFTEALGRPRLIEDEDAIGTFVGLHRMAGGAKGAFMTPGREAFFRDLARLPVTRVDVVAGAAGRPVAAAIGFQSHGVYSLYNSAYHPDHAAASPGMVLLWLLVQSVIDHEVTIFDFLKGDEEYKLRLGAAARPLYALEGRT